MLAFAKFAMHSPSRILLLAGVGGFLPVLSFFSHALFGLVWLRMGPNHGWRVALAASLGAAYTWYSSANPEGFFALIALVLLAEILRAKASWTPVLLVACVLGAFISLGYTWLPADIQAQLLTLIIEHQGWAVKYELTTQQLDNLSNLLGKLLNGAITSVQLLLVILCLILARYWQAGLYNPGGFGQEFHAIRLPLVAGLLVAVSLALVIFSQAQLIAAAPVLLLAHLIAGVASVHAWFKRKNYNSFWLGLLYVLLIFAQPYFSLFLIFLALADSWRKRTTQLAPQPETSDSQANKQEED